MAANPPNLQEAYLAALQDTTLGLVSRLELQELLSAIVVRAGQLVGTIHGFIYLVSQDGSLLLRQVGLGIFDTDRSPRLKPGEGLSGTVWQTGQPLVVNNYAAWSGRPPNISPDLVQSMVGVPLYSGAAVIGVIALAHEGGSGRTFDDEDVDLLRRFAQLASVALDNAQLYRETQRQKQYYESLVQNSPVAIITIDMSAVIVSWNPAAKKLFGYAPNEAIGRNIDELISTDATRAEAEGYTRQVMEQNRVHAIAQRVCKDGGLVDVELLAVPVMVDGERTGFIVIYHDITEMQRARHEAEAASLAKSAFLANMSHELRTPLNAIIGFTRLVRRKAEGVLPEKQVENLDKVMVSAEHLLGLINAILDIAKIEVGRVEAHPSTFDMTHLIELCLNAIRPLLETKPITLHTDFEPDLPMVYADQEKVKQIVSNLLSNAAKFTHEGHITVSLRQMGSWFTVHVSDTGIGIPHGDIEKVFAAFHQVDTSITRQYGGTGLGLAIGRSLARLLGGDLTAVSTVGVGSVFTLTLPLQMNEKTAVSAPPPLPPIRSTPANGKQIVLTIDDDPAVIYLLQEHLQEAGFTVFSATNGIEGIALARQLQPLAITLDIMMPQKDGWQVLHELKADPVTRHIPIIVLSIVDNKALGYQLGASDYLVKPLDAESVLATLRRFAPPVADGGRRLLVVDDDPHVADMVRQMLEGTVFQVETAENGRIALEAIIQHPPDVILLDLLMPQVDGFGVIEQLRQKAEYGRIPIIVLTAKSLTSEEETHLRQTVAQIIYKQGLEAKRLMKELDMALSQATKVSQTLIA